MKINIEALAFKATLKRRTLNLGASNKSFSGPEPPPDPDPIPPIPPPPGGYKKQKFLYLLIRHTKKVLAITRKQIRK